MATCNLSTLDADAGGSYLTNETHPNQNYNNSVGGGERRMEGEEETDGKTHRDRREHDNEILVTLFGPRCFSVPS